jgi:hypothetical protein
LVTALSCLAGLPALLVARFPSETGPLADLDAVVGRSLASGSTTWQGFYVSLLGHRMAGTFAVRFLALASRFVHIYTAERLLVFVSVLALGPATLYFVRRTNPAAEVWALVAPALALSWPLFTGDYGFAAALPIFVATLGYALPALSTIAPARVARIALLMAALMFTSPFLSLVALGVLVGHALITRVPRRTVGLLFAAYVPSLLLIGPTEARYLLEGVLTSRSHAAHPVDIVRQLPSHLAYTQHPIGWALAALPFAVLLALGVRRWLREAIDTKEGRVRIRLAPNQAPAILCALLAIGILTLPNWAPHFSHATDELVLPLLLLSLAWVPAPGGNGRMFAVAGAMALSLATVIVNLREVKALAAQTDRYEALSSAIPDGASLLPLSFAEPASSLADQGVELAHGWAYATIDRHVRVPIQDSAVQSTFTQYSAPQGTAPLILPPDDFAQGIAWTLLSCSRPDWPDLCARQRQGGLESLLRYGRAYDRVLAWQPPAQLVEMARREGYTVERQTPDGVLLLPPSSASQQPVSSR